jgi:C-terminal processing protease CtpA/Prc
MTTTADGRLVFNMDLSGQSYERGFGFSIGGGRDRKMPITIDSVIAGTTADKCGLQVGDQVLSINAESVEDKYHATVNRMIHEAIRLGDIEIVVRRLSGIKSMFKYAFR